jgi:hypothetical protein
MSAGAATVFSDGDPNTSEGTVLTVAGALAIEARACATGGATRASVGFRNISGQGAEIFITNGGATSYSGALADARVDTASVNGEWELPIHRNGGHHALSDMSRG